METGFQEQMEIWHQQAREGDRQAFDALFREIYPPLRFFALRYTPHTAMAEDAAMDSMFKAWERRAEFQTVNNLKAFLYTATRNACLDLLRQERRKSNRESSYSLEALGDEKAIDEYIIEAEVLLLLRNAIRSLPPKCAEVMQLSYEQGLSSKEIAEQLGVSVSTVDNHKARGVALLRNKLGTRVIHFLPLLYLLAN